MKIMCFLRMHRWEHCKCTRCGKIDHANLRNKLSIAAGAKGDLAMIHLLLQGVPERDVKGHVTDALRYAVGHDRIDIVKALILMGAEDPDSKALRAACAFRYSRVELLLRRKFDPQFSGPIDAVIQAEFDQCWLAACIIQKERTLRGEKVDNLSFNNYIYECLFPKYGLEPEDFIRHEMEFRWNWHFTPESGWERDQQVGSNVIVRPEAAIAIEASALLSESVDLGFAEWESVNLSFCLINFAMQRGLEETEQIDSIRAKARGKYRTIAERTVVIRQALEMLLEDYQKPNTYAPNRGVVEKAKLRLGKL